MKRGSLLPCLALSLGVAACGGSASAPPAGEGVPASIPARGAPGTFDVATWNVAWLGDPGNGPRDETLQLRRVREVIQGADLDLWALQEVVVEDTFLSLVAQLPGYRGLLADDPSVEGGPEAYSGFGDREQKVALVYRTPEVEVLGARVVLADRDHAFAGRPPLEVRIRTSVGGSSQEGVVIVLHAKADTAEASWARRSDASAALKAHLDAAWPTARVWILGDLNDDVDRSISAARVSPYANFASDTARWYIPTAALSAAGVGTTTGFPDAVDHIVVSDEVRGLYVEGSAEAFRVDSWIRPYGSTTSDHFPVLARFRPR